MQKMLTGAFRVRAETEAGWAKQAQELVETIRQEWYQEYQEETGDWLATTDGDEMDIDVQ